MSSAQSGSRRQSARLQQKDDHLTPADSTTTNGHNNAHVNTAPTTKVQTSASNPKKRKKKFDEEDDGFVFSRVKSKKPRSSTVAEPDPPTAMAPPPVPLTRSQQPQPIKTTSQPANIKEAKKPATVEPPASEPQDEVEKAEPKKRQKRRMSFSTPVAKQSVRRSKRLSIEAQPDQGSPITKPPQALRPPKIRKEKGEKQKPPVQQQQDDLPPIQTQSTQEPQMQPPPLSQTEHESHSATRIALPFADTPVISRNKAMREGKSGKTERRSSMGLRGRRASSLIDSGTSNALPHAEVESQDFYKHIESELLEPRRMRQLLTWCATRAMHAKPQGTSYAEASAKSVARVIEEELLKDIANKPELSEWFSREDDPAPAVPLPERPNPKNVSNADKISELEAQIKRLRMEKNALEALKKPSSVPASEPFDQTASGTINEELLSEGDAVILQSLRSSTDFATSLATRVNKLVTNLGPSIDVFADGIHSINQYRLGADQVAGQVLSVCARKLADREKEGRRKALGLEEDRSPGRDLSGVLRGLSKTGR